MKVSEMSATSGLRPARSTLSFWSTKQEKDQPHDTPLERGRGADTT